MERLYCSRCLKSHQDGSLQNCPRVSCSGARPQQGWPQFLAAGETIDGRFNVLRLIGAGGAGLTYQCFDTERRQVVALKLIHADRRDGMLTQRLALEGELLELLQHRGIVPFRGIKVVGKGPAWLATNFVEGGTLSDRVNATGPLSLATVASLACQLAETLDYIHRNGVVHRDIKPANLLLEDDTEQGLRVRVADFGIARLFGDRQVPMGLELTQAGLFVGTPEFAAPEQIRGERTVGPGVDKFALGAVLHFAATGDSIFASPSQAEWALRRESLWSTSQRKRLTTSCSPLERSLAASLDRVIDGLMEQEPSERLELAELVDKLACPITSFVEIESGVSMTLCDTPEPEQMQALATVWAACETSSKSVAETPFPAATRIQEPLPELLRESWTAGLSFSGFPTSTRQPGSVDDVDSVSFSLQEPAVADVEVQWLPRAVRRRRTLLRALAAVIFVSFGLESAVGAASINLPSVSFVSSEIASMVGVSRGPLPAAQVERAREEIGEAGPRQRRETTTAALENPRRKAVRSGRGQTKVAAKERSIQTRHKAVVERQVQPAPSAPKDRAVFVAAPSIPKRVVEPPPRLVVGSSDVWGVKSRLGPNVGDALAYNAEDDAVLERLFGED